MRKLTLNSLPTKRIVNRARRNLLRPFILWNLQEVASLSDEGQWQLDSNLLSIEALCRQYPSRIRKIFHYLDLERQGLETVKVAVDRKDWVGACEALVDYYQISPTSQRLQRLGRRYPPLPALPVEQILQDTFTFQNWQGTVPRDSDGLLLWDWNPNGDREWSWFLNRHYHLLNLLYAYQQTGKPIYIAYINQHLMDWIISSFSKPTQWVSQWRGREVALRALHWSSLFYGLSSSAELSPSVRILMLSSLLDHASYLRHLHHWGANWLCREMSGLATIALCWSEFRQADDWFEYAYTQLLQELTRQIYPDGVHKEISSHYHRIVFHDLQNFVELSELMQKPIPAIFKQVLERMLNYLVYSITPTGHSVMNNDSDEEDNRQLVEQWATVYNRPDWLSVIHPDKTVEMHQPSSFFPWSGQVISRSGLEEQAHWSFFDIGPTGINYHIHHDKLHVSIVAGGRHLLVDSGRYRYKKDRFWRYFRSSASHNVILIDGKGQGVDCTEQTYSLTDQCTFTPMLDFAWGSFQGPFLGLKGKAAHTRAVLYLRNKYWVVVDHIETDRPRTIEPLWHFHPNCTVKLEGETAVSSDWGVGNLRIVPVASAPWQVDLVSGQDHPVQGWWSREYNSCVHNPTAIYSTQIATSTTFAWVLYPAIGQVPAIEVQLLPALPGTIHMRVAIPEQAPDEIVVNMTGDQPIPLSDGLVLQGKCAVLSPCHQAIAVQGHFLTSHNARLSDDSLDCSTLLSEGDELFFLSELRRLNDR